MLYIDMLEVLTAQVLGYMLSGCHFPQESRSRLR